MIVKRKVKSAEDKAKEVQKVREKQRRKMIKTKYGQAAMKHAKKGVSSCMYAAAVFFLLAAMITAAYVTKGKTGIFIGFIGLATVVFSWLGLVSGFKGLKERDKNYITCRVGIACNAAMLLGLIIIFFRGLF